MNKELKHLGVRIHINREPYQSPNPTSGEALYALGDIPKDEKLFLEVSGDQEDEAILRDDDTVELALEAHFYSKHVIKIFVNGDEHEINEKEITYRQVVDLFLGSGGKISNEYLVKYSHGPSQNPSGTLPPGQKVRTKDDMRFRVAGTGES